MRVSNGRVPCSRHGGGLGGKLGGGGGGGFECKEKKFSEFLIIFDNNLAKCEDGGAIQLEDANSLFLSRCLTPFEVKTGVSAFRFDDPCTRKPTQSVMIVCKYSGPRAVYAAVLCDVIEVHISAGSGRVIWCMFCVL